MTTLNIRYLCNNLSNLSGMPIALYHGDRQDYYYSFIALPLDPIAPFVREALSVEHIGYFITTHGYYYGVLRFGAERIVLGPTRQVPIAEQELRQIAFEHDVPHADVEEFVKGMKSIRQMPLQSVLQLLCLVNHVLNDGEMLSLSDISIMDIQQQSLVDTMETEAAERTIQKADATDEEIYFHNSMDIEAYMMEAVRKGNVAGLQKLFAGMPAIRSGVMAQSSLRQAKNTLIVTATLVSRAAIYGGMDAEEALTLSDRYIQKAELLENMDALTNLNYRLVMDYAERMERLRYGHDPSPLVIEVNNYVHHHLSEPITVEALAKHLCRGRSRLSTDFKRETGENLSEFILKQKIEEGKKLLRYSGKTVVDIALYLGFASQSHFARTFKRYVGVAPNEYRHTKHGQ